MTYRIIHDIHQSRTHPFIVERKTVSYSGVIEWKYCGKYDHLEHAQVEIKYMKDNPVRVLEVIE